MPVESDHMSPIYPNISIMYVKHLAPRFVSTCLSDIHAHLYVR